MNFEAAIIYLEGTLLDSMDIWERIDAFFFTEVEICLEICAFVR